MSADPKIPVECPHCKGPWHFLTETFLHRPECPRYQPQEIEPVVPTSLDRARWERGGRHPSDHTPVQALMAAADKAKELNVVHVVIFMAFPRPEYDNELGTQMMQAGRFGYYEQVGLCYAGMDIIGRNDD